MTVQQTCNRATQGAGAVTVNDSYLTQTRERCFVEKLIDCIDCFISCLPDHVQLRSRLLFGICSNEPLYPLIVAVFPAYPAAVLELVCLNQFQLFEFLSESQRLHSYFSYTVFDLIDNANRAK